MIRKTAIIAVFTALGLTSALGAEPWPWTAKTPLNPALSILPKVNAMTASAEDKTVKISVKATAPQAGFSEFTLTPRHGKPNDGVFAFDVRGRAPQEGAAKETEVTIEASFTDAPIGKFDTIEVYGKSNCVGYSLKHNLQVDCSGKPQPDTPLP